MSYKTNFGDLSVSGALNANTFPNSITRYSTTQTIPIPAECNGLIIEMAGGGGSGGGYGTSSDSGGGGGGGGYIKIYITKQMISDLPFSSIYFQCGGGGAGVLGDIDGQNGGNSVCFEQSGYVGLIGQANGGYGGIRGNDYSHGGKGGFGSVELAYDDIYEVKYGTNGENGYDAGTALAHVHGGNGGDSLFGLGGRGANHINNSEDGIRGGGGGGAFYDSRDTSGGGGDGMMQLTFY